MQCYVTRVVPGFMYYTNVTFLAMTMRYGYVWFYHRGKLGGKVHGNSEFFLATSCKSETLLKYEVIWKPLKQFKHLANALYPHKELSVVPGHMPGV